MKKQDLNNTKAADILALSKQAKDLKVEIANLTLDKNMGQLKDLKTVAKKRLDLAQVLTILRQKQILASLEKGNN